MGKGLAPFVAFYLGPEPGNTTEGHNRGGIWTPEEWVELGLVIWKRGLRIAVVGASYDRSYWERYVRALAERAGMYWSDFIGRLEIGNTLAFLRQAKCVVSYQCGLGIVGHYLGVRVAMWWRPDGNSIHPTHLISFSDQMKDAWIVPGRESDYIGMLYGRETVADLLGEMDRKEWLR